MKSRSILLFAGSICLVGVLFVGGALSDEPPGSLAPGFRNSVAQGESATSPEENVPRVSLAVARDRAKLLHDVYASTLDVMHRRYFHGDRATVPARAMEDVFSDMKRQSQIEARWISVNLRAMSIDHDPETAFEKRAASEIKSGKLEVETVQDGYYRRAVAIPLSAGCISCHAGRFNRSTKKSYAGLVISIPVDDSDHGAEQALVK